MEDSGSYLPQDRRIALARGIDLPLDTEGSALMADISGFTPMSEAFAVEYGTQRGAEEVTLRLNNFFDYLVHVINNFGGSVISFSGDAVTCWFDHDDGLKAASCALEIQKTFANFPGFVTAAGTRFPVRLKVSFTHGEAQRFVTGDPTVQLLDVMIGEPFDRLAELDRGLKPGEVGLGAALASRLQNRLPPFLTRFLDSGHLVAILDTSASHLVPIQADPMPLPELSEELSRQWILPRVFQRLSQGRGAFMADMRLAAVFFLKYRLEEGALGSRAAQTSAILAHFQKVINFHGGSLLQVIVGDKGNYIYGAFGAPQANENDPARAMTAIMEIRDQTPAELGLAEIRAGLSRGQIYAGTYGGGERKTFGVLGNEVNIAARLMESADPGSLLVTAAIQRVSQEKFEFEALGTREFKGIQNPIPLFKLKRSKSRREIQQASQSQAARLFGREAELTALVACLTEVATGQNRLALIEGSPGIGKSRLSGEIILQAKQAGFWVFHGEAAVQEMATSFYIWRTILRQAFGLEPLGAEANDEELILQKLTTDYPQSAGLAALLNPLLTVTLDDTPLTLQLSGENRLNTLQDFLLTFFRTEIERSGKPVLVVLEDVQWQDQASWRLLNQLISGLTGVFFLLDARIVPTGDEPDLDRFLELPNLLKLHLEPLAGPAVLAMVNHHLGTVVLQEELGDFLLEKAGGNPFFSLELASAFRDAGLLNLRDKQARLSDKFQGWNSLPFPDNLQGVVASRIDHLSPVLQDLLKVGSVFGLNFTMAALEGVYAQRLTSPGNLIANLVMAERQEMLYEDRQAVVKAYLFRHIVIQQVSYGLLLSQQKQDLHLRVAQWLETLYMDNLTPYAGLLSFHWKRAERPEKAIPYLVMAGYDAMKVFSNLEAIPLFEEALRLDQAASQPILTDDERGRIAINLGEAFVQNSNYPMGVEWFEKGLAWLGFPIPNSDLWLVAPILKELVIQKRHRRTGRFKARTGVERLTLVCKTLITLVEVYAAFTKPLKAVYATLAGTNLAEDLGLAGEKARAYSYCSVLLQFSGLKAPAADYAKLSDEVLQQGLPLVERILPLLGLGFYESGMGEFEHANRNFSLLEQACRMIGDKRRLRDANQCRLLIQIFLGDWERASLMSIELKKLNLGYEDLDMYSLAESLAALTSMMAGNLPNERSFLGILDVASRIKTPSYKGPVFAVLAFISKSISMDEVSEMLGKQVETAIKMRPTKVFSFYLLFVYYAEFCLLRLRGDWTNKNYRSSFVFSIKELYQYQNIFPIGFPAYCFLYGSFLILYGKQKHARKLFLKGYEFASAKGMAFEKNRLEMMITPPNGNGS